MIIRYTYSFKRAPLVTQMVKNLPAMQETRFSPWVGKMPWKREWLIYSSILAWRIPWTEEPGGLQFIGSQSWTQLSH